MGTDSNASYEYFQGQLLVGNTRLEYLIIFKR
jgi:hypothetical protein